MNKHSTILPAISILEGGLANDYLMGSPNETPLKHDSQYNI